LYLNNKELTHLEIPSDIVAIKSYAFENCISISTISFPEQVQEIGHSAFKGCKNLTSIKLPDGFAKLDCYAFSGCESLTSAMLGNTLREIGSGAFFGCPKLTYIYCGARSMPEVIEEGDRPDDVFDQNIFGRKIQVISDVADVYKVAPYWCLYANEIVGGDYEY
jgi:hypothetical protein